MNINFILIIIVFIKINLIKVNSLLKYKEEEGIALLTINNQKSLNFLNIEILEELDKFLDIIDANKINLLLIFFNGSETYSVFEEIDKINTLNKKELEKILKKGNIILRKIEKSPIPVISVINGLCLGTFFEISLSCHIRICSENAIFCLPEVKLGFTPGFAGTHRLSRLVGVGIAKQMIYTSQNVKAEEVLKFGLVNNIYPQNELLNEAKKFALNLVNKNSKNNKKILINEEMKTNCDIVLNNNNNYINFQIQIKYETKIDEIIYIYGNISDFGNWKPKFKLNWNPGHIWKTEYKMQKSSYCIKFKFLCHSYSYDKWEEGDNRLLCPNNLNGIPKTSEGKYILDFVWNHFKINFNIHYIPSNQNIFMQIEGSPDSLSNWQSNNKRPIKMELQNNKEITAKDGNKIKGFWTVTVLMKISDKKNFDFEYRYSLFDQNNNMAIWEREPNRHLHIFSNEEEISFFQKDKNNLDSLNFLKNSFLEVLDVNFVANLEFDKMGDKNIYIGPYPQFENDFKLLSESGIDTILNIQSDKDFKVRQINYELQLKQAKKYGININRYPIEDFNQEDLYKKLKGAGDLLNDLLKKGKKVYVHCTAGMSRSAAAVIIYLVLYENYTVEEANNFCKKYRPIICPNYGVINRVAYDNKPGTEMSGEKMYVFTL